MNNDLQAQIVSSTCISVLHTNKSLLGINGGKDDTNTSRIYDGAGNASSLGISEDGIFIYSHSGKPLMVKTNITVTNNTFINTINTINLATIGNNSMITANMSCILNYTILSENSNSCASTKYVDNAVKSLSIDNISNDLLKPWKEGLGFKLNKNNDSAGNAIIVPGRNEDNVIFIAAPYFDVGDGQSQISLAVNGNNIRTTTQGDHASGDKIYGGGSRAFLLVGVMDLENGKSYTATCSVNSNIIAFRTRYASSKIQ